jgi:ABC-type antimicrobial peptide transport system permease subunit
MHCAVVQRTVEIATLRASCFAAGAAAASILIEALLLALVGAAIGVASAHAAFNGTVISTLGGADFDSQIVYALVITPSLVAISVLLACAVGLLAAFFPRFAPLVPTSPMHCTKPSAWAYPQAQVTSKGD